MRIWPVLLSALMLLPPSLAEAQALSARDVSDIERASAAYVGASLPAGASVAFDARVRGQERREARHVADLAGVLKARQARSESVYRCDNGSPRSCHLDVDALVVMQTPTPTRDGATVIVEVRSRTNIERMPVGRETKELILTNAGHGWRVLRVGRVSAT
jgi:hypothetical protein